MKQKDKSLSLWTVLALLEALMEGIRVRSILEPTLRIHVFLNQLEGQISSWNEGRGVLDDRHAVSYRRH